MSSRCCSLSPPQESPAARQACSTHACDIAGQAASDAHIAAALECLVKRCDINVTAAEEAAEAAGMTGAGAAPPSEMNLVFMGLGALASAPPTTALASKQAIAHLLAGVLWPARCP